MTLTICSAVLLAAATLLLLAIFVYPANTTTLPDRTAAEIEARATSARTSLQHAGWDVVLIQPDGRLADVWQATKNKRLRPVGSFS